MMRPALLFVLAVACSHGVRKDVTPPLLVDAPSAAAHEAGLKDGPELSPHEMAEHALSRLTFGARAQDRERIGREGIAAFVEEQLHPEQIDDSAVEQRLASLEVLNQGRAELTQRLVAFRKANQLRKRNDDLLETAPAPPPGEEMAAPKDLRKPLGKAGRGPGYEDVAQLSQAKVIRAVESKRQLQEEMIDFWFNHFNIFAGKENEAALLPDYEQRVLRPNALATFPELLEATAHSPAMLIYLDNWRSAAPLPWRRGKNAGQKRGINENYARELLELHTMGVDGGYTQQDVVEVARCFTGWTVDEPQKDPKFVFRPRLHDFGVKHVLGHVIPAGHGQEDGEEVLRILSRHPATAHFIALQLSRRFVSDDPPAELVQRVADAYLRTDGDIRSMLRTIFESPQFWSRKALRAKVRSPLEFVAGSVRALDASVDDPMALAKAVARIGEPLYAAQPPTGYPDVARTWLSPGALLARMDFAVQLANGQLDGVKVDLSRLAAPAPEALLDRAAAELGATQLSQTTRNSTLAQLREAPREAQIARAVALLLGAPELQRR